MDKLEKKRVLSMEDIKLMAVLRQEVVSGLVKYLDSLRWQISAALQKKMKFKEFIAETDIYLYLKTDEFKKKLEKLTADQKNKETGYCDQIISNFVLRAFY